MTATYDTFPSQTFDQFVTNFLNILQTSTPAITDASEGSVALALAESTAGNDLSLQALIYHVYNVARLTTSYGVDVDSFVGDFGLTRAPASYASGAITLTRQLTTTTLSIPAGAIVQTAVGAIQFQLIADTTQPNWNAGTNSYVFNIGQASIKATVQALVAGSAGNVLAGTVTQLVSGITGVNSITNGASFSGGSDEETDAALKIRFQLYIESLGKATVQAVEAAIAGVQAGLTYQLIEYEHFDGTPWIGGFTVVVDDGSGDIPGTTIANITTAINLVRAAGISFLVVAPTDETINVTVTFTAASGYTDSAVETAIINAVTTYILGLGVGVSVNFVNMANVIQNAQIGGVNCVYSYSNLLINGEGTNYSIALTQLARPGSITPTPTS